MNKLKILIILTMIVLGLTGCQSPHETTTSNHKDATNTNNGRVLVAYFSLYGKFHIAKMLMLLHQQVLL